jgi:hypothetical protein
METTLQGELTLAFVMGGISSKSNKPYLQVSDGVEARFVDVSNVPVDEDTFADYNRGDEISLTVEVNPFSSKITVLEM